MGGLMGRHTGSRQQEAGSRQQAAPAVPAVPAVLTALSSPRSPRSPTLVEQPITARLTHIMNRLKYYSMDL